MLDEDIPLVLLSHDGRPRGRLESPATPSIELRRAQLVASNDNAARLIFARAVIRAKIHNQRVLLLRRARQLGPQAGASDFLRLASSRLKTQEKSLGTAASVMSVLGIEGSATRTYYAGWRKLIPSADFGNRGRQQPDVVNAMLNYGSALLREVVLGAILAAGLEPHVSFMHVPSRGRPTLAFDLMEEWRPVLVDTAVLATLGLGQTNPNDLTVTTDGPRLSSQARTMLIERFHHRLETNSQIDPTQATSTTYRDRLHQQAALVATWLNGDKQHYSGFIWR